MGENLRRNPMLVRFYSLVLMGFILWTGYATGTYFFDTVSRSRVPQNWSNCLECHGPTGTAGKPTLVQHSDDAFESLKLPPITCTTCHIPHGDGKHQSKVNLHTGVAEKLCTKCHDTNANKLFIHFHKPGLRQE